MRWRGHLPLNPGKHLVNRLAIVLPSNLQEQIAKVPRGHSKFSGRSSGGCWVQDLRPHHPCHRWSQCHCHHCHLCLRWSCCFFASLLSSFASIAFLMFLESLVSTSQILWSHARLWATWSIHGHVSLLQVLSLSA